MELGGERDVAPASRSCWRRRRPAARRGAAGRRSPRRRAAAPARASTTSSATSASASAARAWSWIETASGSVVVEVDAAGVDQREAPPVPVGRELLAVARDARALVHDRLARLREAVDERGLADVRIADDGDLHRPALLRLAGERRRSAPTTSSSVRPVVSRAIASGRARAARARAPRSRSSRSLLRSTAATSAPSSAARRRARSSGVGGEEHLDLGVGRDDGADVAALGDPVAVREQLALLRDERLAHAGSAATREAASDDSGVADRLGDVARRRAARGRRARCATLARPRRRRRRVGGGERDAAVHRARVQVREAEPLGDGAGDGGLAGPRGPVDRDDHGGREA